MSRSFEDQVARAQSLIAESFPTKQAKANALYYLSNAFEIARREIQDALLAVQPERSPFSSYPFPKYEEWSKLYDAAPYQLSHWRPKHSETLAAYAAPVAKIETLVKMRETIQAIPVVKPAPKRTAKQIAEDAKKRTCQICGRPIYAETGLIAHHGYQRPGDGYQTESCSGARELPFEADKAILVAHIATQASILADMENDFTAISYECQDIRLSYEVARKVDGKPIYYRGEKMMDTVYFSVTRENFGEMKAAHPGYFRAGYVGRHNFDEVLSSELAARGHRIAQQKQYLEWQEGRAATWAKREVWNGKAEKWEAL